MAVQGVARDSNLADTPEIRHFASDVLDRIQDGFYVVDRNWRLVYVNRRACEMWGTTREAILGRVLWQCFPKLNGTAAGQQLRAAVEAGTASEFEALSPAVRRWLWVRIDPIRPEITGIYWRDITDRKRAEAELRRLAGELEARVDARTRELADTNDRLRRERLLSELIVENTTEGIIVVDNEMKHRLWNAGMETIEGLPRAEVLGKTVFEMFPHLVDHPVGQAWRDALAGRRTELRGRRDFASGRGVEIVYDADHAPLYDHGRSIIGAVSIVRETTERHRMEEMLRHSQKLEAVAQLTDGVAHDFNNLLTAVVGCLDMISSEVENPRLRRLAQTALRSADRGAQLTHQLLSFARQQELKSVVADINDLLSGMGMLLRRAAGEAIEMVVDSALDLWPSEIDPAQFETAVMNLVMNAHDAMPKSGRLVLSTRNVEGADIPAGVDLPPGQYIALSVRDTGMGMTRTVKARAFEPFYTTKEVGKGSGLGLSTVYGFARQSGGDVQLESAPGAGTCVTIFLPRAALPVGSAAAAGTADRAPDGVGSILVVEDDPDVRAVTLAMLEGLGYRASVVGSGPEALAALRRDDPIGLLFTDVVMPLGVTGVDLARQAQALRPGLKVLLTTGYAGQQTSAVGEFPLLSKPFRPSELGRVLAVLLRGPNTN